MATIPGLGFLPENFNSNDKEYRPNEVRTDTALRHDGPVTGQTSAKLDEALTLGDRPAYPRSSPVEVTQATRNSDEGKRQDNDQDVRMDNTLSGKLSTLIQEQSTSSAIPHHSTPAESRESQEGHVAPQCDEQILQSKEDNVQRHAKNAEWSFDVSDEDSSDPSSASDTSEDSSDDAEESEAESSACDDYELLDPAEQARILMKDDPEDESRGPNGAAFAPKTANERVEDVIQRPDISITEEMGIEELGIVETIVESFALVKGTVRSETKVLGSGSPLCLKDRTIIGSVAEPVGRVDDPRYSVAFNSASEMIDLGIVKGCRIFYPPDLADYVFTQPLKLIKGSDASNMHDEEVNREEVEFSDDEVEAAYKRQKKLERQTKKGNTSVHNSMSSYGRHVTGQTADGVIPVKVKKRPQEEPLEYDDDLYTVLPRPHTLYGVESGPSNLPPTMGYSASRRASHQSRASSRGQSHKKRGQHGKRGLSGRDRQDYDHAGLFQQPIQVGQQSISTAEWQSTSNGSLQEPSGTSLLGQASNASLTSHDLLAGSSVAHVSQRAMPGVPPGAFVNPAFFQSQQASTHNGQHYQTSHHPSDEGSEGVASSSHEQNSYQRGTYWH